MCLVWGVFGLLTFCWTSSSLMFEVPGLGSSWSANLLLDLIFPYFWGARFGEYLVCQLLVGPHIPLFLSCQVWGVPGQPIFRWISYSPIFGVPGLGSSLPTFRWTSYSLSFEVPGLGSTWSANFSLDLIFPYFGGAMFGEYLVCQLFNGPHFWGARFREYLVCQLFDGPHTPLFLRCQVWGVPGLPTFRWTSYSLIFEGHLIFPYFWGSRLGEYLVCQLFIETHIPLFLMCPIQVLDIVDF